GSRRTRPRTPTRRPAAERQPRGTRPARPRARIPLDARKESTHLPSTRERRGYDGGTEGRGPAGPAPGHAGPAGAEGAGARADARLGDHGAAGAVVGERAAAGAGLAVPGAVPAGAAGSDPVGVADDGEQPAGAVLLVDAGGPEAFRARAELLAAPVARDQPRATGRGGLRGSSVHAYEYVHEYEYAYGYVYKYVAMTGASHEQRA